MGDWGVGEGGGGGEVVGGCEGEVVGGCEGEVSAVDGGPGVDYGEDLEGGEVGEGPRGVGGYELAVIRE